MNFESDGMRPFMQKTLLEIQRILVDVRTDAVLFKMTPTVKKIEKMFQLLEGAIKESKAKAEFRRAFRGVRTVIGQEDEK